MAKAKQISRGRWELSPDGEVLPTFCLAAKVAGVAGLKSKIIAPQKGVW